MNLDARVIQEAQALLNAEQSSVARKEQELMSIGCSFCANCSGIVGG